MRAKVEEWRTGGMRDLKIRSEDFKSQGIAQPK